MSSRSSAFLTHTADRSMWRSALLRGTVACVILSAAPEAFAAQVGNPARLQSSYKELTADVVASNIATKVLLSASLAIPSGEGLLITAEGRVFPSNGIGSASLRIFVDGSAVGNLARIDWALSTSPGQHSFACLAPIKLDAGVHTIELRALSGQYTVGMDTNLSIFVAPAGQITSSDHSASSYAGTVYDLDTSQVGPDTQTCATFVGYQQIYYDELPHKPIAETEHMIDGVTPFYVFAAGTSIDVLGSYGDAAWSVFVEGEGPVGPPLQGYLSAGFGANDLWKGAELTAPMYCQAVFDWAVQYPGLQTMVTVGLDGSELPFCQTSTGTYNSVRYHVDLSSTVAVLSGGMVVHGWAATNRPTFDVQGNEYFCVAGWTGGSCGAENQPIEIASETFTVPDSHDGIVYFSARARAQGDPTDGAGDVLLWIEIDGTPVGSYGVQQLGGAGNSVSQRSLCASYLATGANALAQGKHVVKLFARVNSNAAPGFRHLGMHNDRPLIVWID